MQDKSEDSQTPIEENHEMARYAASPILGGGGYGVSEQDADGVGRDIVLIHYASGQSPLVAEKAARLLVLAGTLEGGWEKAIELLRAERVRQD